MSARVVDDPKAPEGFSLKRWSRRKLEVARATPSPAPAAIEPAAAPNPGAIAVPAAPVSPDTAPAAVTPEATLAPVDTLTFDSDFSVYFQPKVDEGMKRAALKKLLSDPRFNVMDGLDTYIDDYTKSDPLPAGLLDRLAGIYQTVTKDDVADKEADPVGAAADTAAARPQDDVPGETTTAAESEGERDAPLAAADEQPDTPAAPVSVDSVAPIRGASAEPVESALPAPRTGKSA